MHALPHSMKLTQYSFAGVLHFIIVSVIPGI